MNKRYVLAILFLVGLLFDYSGAADQIELPSFISHNMVLQQQSDVPFWGWIKTGKKVTVNCSWDNKDVVAIAGKDGKWKVEVKTPEAGGPYSITINDDTIKNVMIGEVWVCSGQSNMQWALDNTDGGLEEIEKAAYPKIRFFYAARQLGDNPQDNCYGNWVECSPKTARTFSAVAYYFGRKIYKELNVPIGLIHTSWGGSSAEAWIKKEVLEEDPDYQIYFDRQKERVLNAQPGILPLDQRSPCRLYNAMIHPFIQFAIRGVIWYQGEANTGEALLYEKLFPTLITNWRDDWQQGDFPFYFVQLAPYNYDVPMVGALVRDSQRKSLSVPKTGMAVTMDIGNPSDIHPRNKLDVGERLALWALAKDYGKNNIVFSGPLYKTMQIEKNKVRIYFDYTGGGLMAKGRELTHFEIAGEDKLFYPGKALIDGQTVLVESEKVKNPRHVRYAFRNADEPNLYNQEGLPASSFRTDNWPIITEQVKILSSFDVAQDKFIIELKADQERASIYYTLDGTIPNLQSKQYSEPFSVTGSETLSARIFIDREGSVDLAKKELLRHKGTGRKVKYIENYSSKYPGGGDLSLVNSLRGSENFRDDLWQGFEGNNLDVVIDLGKEQTVSSFSIGTLQSVNSWIFFPKTVIILASDDGEEFDQVAEIHNDVSDKLKGNILKTFEAEVNKTKTRFVRIVAENIGVCPQWHPGAGGKAWIFVDEIIIE